MSRINLGFLFGSKVYSNHQSASAYESASASYDSYKDPTMQASLSVDSSGVIETSSVSSSEPIQMSVSSSEPMQMSVSSSVSAQESSSGSSSGSSSVSVQESSQVISSSSEQERPTASDPSSGSSSSSESTSSGSPYDDDITKQWSLCPRTDLTCKKPAVSFQSGTVGEQQSLDQCKGICDNFDNMIYRVNNSSGSMNGATYCQCWNDCDESKPISSDKWNNQLYSSVSVDSCYDV